MKAIILDGVQSEDIVLVQSLFDGSTIIALDTMSSMFNRIYKQLDIPHNYLQGFIKNNGMYLYYFRPEHIDSTTADATLIKLHQ